MSNQTNKKALNNRVNNKEMELEMSLRSIWLGMCPTLGTPYSLVY